MERTRSTSVSSSAAESGQSAFRAWLDRIRGNERLLTFLSRYGVLLALLILIGIFGGLRPDSFLTADNARSILSAAAPLAIVSLGLTVVLVMGDFDLSIGSMVGLGGAAAIALMLEQDVFWLLAIIAALGLGVAAGTANGLLTAYANASSFIVTLAMATILVGIEFAITGQKTIYGDAPESYTTIGQARPLLDINAKVWIAALVAIAIYVLLEQTEIGRYMYAIGGNPEAARLSGIRVKRFRLAGFIIVAVLAALAGILLTAASGSSSPNAGLPFLLPAFAAVFLGSAVFRPGQFNALGTVVGVLFLGIIQTGLVMLQLSTAVINVVQGSILIGAVLLSRLGSRT